MSMEVTTLDSHWGLHTVIDMTDCYPEEISSYESIELWVTTLVAMLDMEAYGEPQIVRFGKEDKFGYTCVQLIQTSNICAHFAEDTNSVFIDVFSCKPYDPDVVVAYCMDVFGGQVTKFETMFRG